VGEEGVQSNKMCQRLGAAKEKSSPFFSSRAPASVVQHQWRISIANEQQKILVASKRCFGGPDQANEAGSPGGVLRKKKLNRVCSASLEVVKCFCGPELDK
jgi:hypothetical protein